MNSRDLVLHRVRTALADVPPDENGTIRRDYLHTHGHRTPRETVDLLAENLADYRAAVHLCHESGLAAVVGRLLEQRGSRTLLVPDGVPEAWLTATAVRRVTDGEQSAHALDAVDSVLTGCALAIAETGTVVLDGSAGQGRRRATLVPDHHICVVRVPDQAVGSVPAALARLDPARPLTWISGPSATSDIELTRVEGVHGPRHLDVVLVGEVP